MSDSSEHGKTFFVQGYGDEYDTGCTSDNRQVVIGLLCPNLVAYFFSSEGTLLGCEEKSWRYPAPFVNGVYGIYDPPFVMHLSEQMQEWKDELGFASGTVHLQSFMDEEHYVGVGFYALDTEDMDPEDLAYFEENPQIVFFWAKEYFLAPDGEVEST